MPPPRLTTLHLFHGSADAVIAADGSRQALAWMAELEGDATLDVAEGVGHELHPALVERALWRLTHHIPQRTWREALGVTDEEVPGHVLRGSRFREGLTQVQLAKLMGIPQRHISEMEHGKRPIGREMAKRLGKALNISYKVFL